MTYSKLQKEVLNNANARWNILCGAVSSGKTYLTYDLLPIRVLEQPPGGFLLIGKTERTLKRNVLDPMRERFGERYVSQIKGDGEIYLWGRKCYIAGANDAKAVSKIQGITLAYAYGDEVTTWDEDVFQMLKSRLRIPGALFDGTCNPDAPTHYLKEFLDDKELDIKQWTFTLDDNPFLDPKYVRDLKSEYTGVWYKRYILGMWVIAAGAIYDMWDPELHTYTVEPAHLNSEEVVRYIGIDYGTTNPTGFLDILDDGCILWVTREYYYDSKKRGKQKSDEQYATDLEDFMATGMYPKAIILDPSAASFRTALRNRGIRTREADNEVLDGLRMVASLFKQGRLKIHKSCENLIKEIESYVWDDKAATARGKEQPVKANDHACDALRYVVKTMIRPRRLTSSDE